MSNTKTILIIAANPSNETQLRLHEEARDIEEGLLLAKHRDQFILKQQQATRVRDLSRAMQNHEPTIVHFCGHGTGEQGIVFEDIDGKAQLVSTEALANFFGLFTGKVDCVILNACFSEIQAKAIVQHIPYVIGMSESIGDKAAIEFSVGFYGSLASGDDYERAYEFGRIAIEMAGVYGHSIPQLFKKTEQTITEKQNKYLDDDKIKILKLPCKIENIAVEDMAQKDNESLNDDKIKILKLLYKVENIAVDDMAQKLNMDIQQINYYSIELQSLKMAKAVNLPRQKIMTNSTTYYNVPGYQIEQKGRKYIIENKLNLT